MRIKHGILGNFLDYRIVLLTWVLFGHYETKLGGSSVPATVVSFSVSQTIPMQNIISL